MAQKKKVSVRQKTQPRMQRLSDILLRLTVVAGLYVVGGAAFYHKVEGFSWLDSFYFVVVTLTSVGFGDIVPETDGGKLFTIFYVIIGVTIIIGFTRALLLDRFQKRGRGLTKR